MSGLFCMPKKGINSEPRKLFIRKLRHVIRHLKSEYGFRSIEDICRYLGEPRYFLGNILTNERSRYLQGPPLLRMHNLCKQFDLSLEYFANNDLPVHSSFVHDTEPNVFTLQTRFRGTGEPRYLHMAAGYALGEISKHCKARMVTHGTYALITVFAGPKAGITYVIKSDEFKRFTISHTYSDLSAAQGESLLTDANLTSLCERLEQEKEKL